MKQALLALLLLASSSSFAGRACEAELLEKNWMQAVQAFGNGQGTWRQVLVERFNYLFNIHTCPQLTEEAYCIETPGLGDTLENQDRIDYQNGRIQKNVYVGTMVLNGMVHNDCKGFKK